MRMVLGKLNLQTVPFFKHDFHCFVAQSWQYYIVLGLRVYVEFHKFWDFLWTLGIFKAKQAICMWWTSLLEFNSVEVVNDFSNWFWSWQGTFLQKSVKSIVKHSCYCHWIALQNFAFVIPCKLFKVVCVTLLFHDYLYDFRPSKKQMKRNKMFLGNPSRRINATTSFCTAWQ